MPQIRRREFDGLLVDSPEMLFAASSQSWESVCYSFAGLNNPVAVSRYPWARIMGGCFERRHIACLNRIRPDAYIAAADSAAIEAFHRRTGNALDRSRFHQFPTRVDTGLFFPMDMEEARRELGLPMDAAIFVATGRLCWTKGWDLLLESFVRIRRQCPSSALIFLGDGEDRGKALARAGALGVRESVTITGFLPQSAVARHMNAASVCLVGSRNEGWSLAMCEMVACGKAVVSTDVSGARDMVEDGLNGYVVRGRDPQRYAEAVGKAMKLENAAEHSLRLAGKYAVKNLASDLGALWPPLGRA
jgi:glycosyltransferase involved in cell wall biosynthesis